MNAASWVKYRGKKRRLSEVCQKETYIGALALSFLRGAIVLLMSGSCATVMELQIRRRLLRFAPYYSSGVTACLAGADLRNLLRICNARTAAQIPDIRRMMDPLNKDRARAPM